MTTDTKTRPGPETPAVTPRTAAVIDIGATAVRMAVAEIGEAGEVRTLDTLSRPLALGRDTFTGGQIARDTIEECVTVLRGYRQVLQEYAIEKGDVRVVATSAVREASNRLAFLDRVSIGTGFRVETVDDAEVARLTYLGIQPLLADPKLAGRVLVTEVGGGSTEMLLLEEGDVAFNHVYRLGSLRLRKTIETHRFPEGKVRPAIVNQVRRVMDQVKTDVHEEDGLDVLALGGDMRFASRLLVPAQAEEPVREIPLKRLAKLAGDLLDRTPEEVVRDYNVTYPEAESLGPSLIAVVELVKAYGGERVFTADTTLRDGLLREVAVGRAWTQTYREQIVNSALEIARKYQVRESHARNVAAVATRLFHELQEEHGLEPKYEILLHVAALLHDMGHIINSRAHHKHSYYLIRNVDIFGLGGDDLLLTALIARYHRRATPRATHDGYAALDHDHRITLAKLAAILRVADALDRVEGRKAPKIRCTREDGRLVITVPGTRDLSLEELSLRQKGDFFESVFGLEVQLRSGGRS
jgi:exopolyphosphatase/guanosine-5'-triphosphate,3'-diphosphate pyrophosphatase